jgi:hypothetical protein
VRPERRADLCGAQLIDVTEQLFEARAHLLAFFAQGRDFSVEARVRVFGFFEVNAEGVSHFGGVGFLHSIELAIVGGRFLGRFIFVAQTVNERDGFLDALLEVIERIDFLCCGSHLVFRF